MAENDLYATTGAVGPGYGDQMDPLGTAGQNAFDQASPAFGAAPVEPVLGDAPAAASVKIGKTAKPKKKLSTGRKIAYGVGGLVAAFFALVIVLDPSPEQGTASPRPPAGALVVAEQASPPAAVEPTTVMGGSPTVDLLDIPPGAQPAAMQAPPPAPAAATAATAVPPVAASAQASAPAPALIAPAPAPVPATAAAPATAPALLVPVPAPAPAAASVTAATAATPAAQLTPTKPAAALVATTPAPAEKLVMIKDKAPVAPASREELAARVATLEKRLARYERSEARERAQAARAAAQVRVAAPAPSWKRAPAPVVSEARKLAVLPSDNVRVVGVSTRHGITTALVDFGGAKHRVAAGESIPGLGTVGSVATDAAGNPVVEVNGVRYQ